jgi:uncharacterized membrane protein YccF (DUF307 family)
MPLMSLLLNVLWIVFGGAWMALGWVIAAAIVAITIIGLRWARAALNIAAYTLLPFGQKAVSRAEYTGEEDLGTGPLGFVGNLIWLVARAGAPRDGDTSRRDDSRYPLRLGALELAGVALWPIGKMIVPV